MKRSRKYKRCTQCGAQCNDAFICAVCADSLRELLIGSEEARGQPGIVWYITRLREQAYGQARLGNNISTKLNAKGYGLLADRRATELLDRISFTLKTWEGHCEALRAPEKALVHLDTTGVAPEVICVRRARYIATKIKGLRTQRHDVHNLHAALMLHAKDAWKVINRPADTCCGPCPRCATILYAEINDPSVRCPRCRCSHDVDELRSALREMVRGTMFSGPELLALMENRLNDRMPKSTFYALIRDNRLRPRHTREDGTEMFTYEDVVAAREGVRPK